jgi:hypothetical protein
LLPPLGGRHAHAQPGAPKRIVFFHTPNGLLRQETLPDAAGNFKRILAPLAAHKQHITTIDGLHMNSFLTKPIPNDHPPPLGQLMTGTDTIDPKDGKAPSASTSWYAADVSIDQYLGTRTNAVTPMRHPTLVLGVEVGSYGWHISHSGYRKPVFPDNDAAAVRARLVQAGAGTTQPAPAISRLWAARKSARTSVKRDLDELLQQVGGADKLRIQAHLDLLADSERREALTTTPVTMDACKTFKSGPAGADNYEKNGRAQMDNIALAFACNLCRVALLQWDICASGRRFGAVGVGEAHHDLSHEQPHGGVYEGLTKIGAWYARQFLYFIELLKSMPEGTGSVFDSTLLVWLSEHSSSSGDHGRQNLPFILAGNLGGALKTGGSHLKLNRSHNDFFVTVAQAMGFADVTTFGRKDVCKGPIAELV